MHNLRLLFISLLIASLCNCSNEEFGKKENYLGPNGEPPKGLKSAYEKEFIVEQKHYISALGEIHSFMLENGFHPHYEECFNSALDIKITANIQLHKATFPCIAVHTSKYEDTPAMLYITASVQDVKFNQLDGNNRAILKVGIYGNPEKKLLDEFNAHVESKLKQLGGAQ